MKKRKIAAYLLAIGMIFAGVLGINAQAKNNKTIDVMFVHDTHSHLNEFTTVEDGETQTLGGFAKLKTLIDAQKVKNPDTLLLDGGDFSMGTLIQVMYQEEASELRMLGEIGIDATTLGNHEFDYNAKGIAGMLTRAANSGDNVPALVVCNVDWDAMHAEGLTSEQEMLSDAFETYGVEEYIVIEKGDVKIAVTGVFGIDCLACTPNCPLVFKDPVEAVKETVEEIKANEDVDMIACVSHSGVWEDEEKSEDEILAKAVPDLDLIVSGHTHTKLDEPIQHGSTYIASAAEYGKYLGNLSMSQNEDGTWTMTSYELIKVDTSIESDADTQEKIDALMAEVDNKYLKKFGYTKDQVLCENDVEFVNSQDLGALHTEMNLGNIMSDAYPYTVESASDFDGHKVDVAVVPAGVVRDSYPMGNITTENVFHSFSLGIGADEIPGYPLISVYLTGAELKIAAELDASISDLMSGARLYADGLYWHYNPNRLLLNKVTDVYICDENEQRVELEDDKLYRVVTDYYTSQMLGGVTDLSYGLLKLVPKHADGTPITDYNDAIIMNEGKEMKAWAAIANYMESFEDTDGDGVPNVPEKYENLEGRKVVEDSKKITDLIKNPNKFFWMILAVIVVVLAIFIGIIFLIKKIIKRFRVKK